eukprot:scaffold47230_cov32-Tisochrysis_lutea.AAC.2
MNTSTSYSRCSFPSPCCRFSILPRRPLFSVRDTPHPTPTHPNCPRVIHALIAANDSMPIDSLYARRPTVHELRNTTTGRQPLSST